MASKPVSPIPLRALERQAVVFALFVTAGDVTEAARRLGMGRATLYKYLKRTGIPHSKFKVFSDGEEA